MICASVLDSIGDAKAHYHRNHITDDDANGGNTSDDPIMYPEELSMDGAQSDVDVDDHHQQQQQHQPRSAQRRRDQDAMYANFDAGLALIEASKGISGGRGRSSGKPRTSAVSPGAVGKLLIVVFAV